MTTYEVVEFYHGTWGSSCGEFDTLEKAVQRKELCEEQSSDKSEHFKIIVQTYEDEK